MTADTPEAAIRRVRLAIAWTGPTFSDPADLRAILDDHARLVARVGMLEKALRQCSASYFWQEDGFWSDASTPGHREQELYRRLKIARDALNHQAHP